MAGLVKRTLRDAVAHTIATIVPPGLFRDARYFRLWERHGYHITPVHFYSPLPDVHTLVHPIWDQPSALAGIDMNDEMQLELLASLSRYTHDNIEGFSDYFETRSSNLGVPSCSFNAMDAELLYAMVRHLRPRRIIEVGAGISSHCIGEALRRNSEHDEAGAGEYISIEPFPNRILLQDVPCLSRLIEDKVQSLPISYFQRLGKNDILFIDSTHVCRIGSDVKYLMLEVIPTLQPGTVLHFHDIFLPREYPRSFIMDKFCFWNEQYILQAFLAFNVGFRILLTNNYLRHKYAQRCQEVLTSDVTVQEPGSFWIQKTG